MQLHPSLARMLPNGFPRIHQSMIGTTGYDEYDSPILLTDFRRKAIFKQIRRQTRGRKSDNVERVIFADNADFNDGDSGNVDVLTLDPRTGSDSGREKLRTAAIDSPEWKQLFGPEAADIAHDLFEHAEKLMVYIIGRGKFGRALSWIYLLREGKTPISFNQEMVRQGGAWHLDFYHPDAEFMWELEREAQEKRRGLWKDLDGPNAEEVKHPCHFRDQDSGKPYRPLRHREGVPFFDTLNRQTKRVGLFGRREITLERASV